MVCSIPTGGHIRFEPFRDPSLEHINQLRDDVRRTWSPEERASRAARGHSRRRSMLLSILVFGDCRSM